MESDELMGKVKACKVINMFSLMEKKHNYFYDFFSL